MSIRILTFDVTSHDSLKMGAIIAEISVLHSDQVHYVHLIRQTAWARSDPERWVTGGPDPPPIGKSQSYKVLWQYLLDRAFNVEL